MNSNLWKAGLLALCATCGAAAILTGLAAASTSQDVGDDPAVADREAIRRAAMDYMEGWYTADAERMKGCLHPQLAKRISNQNPTTGEWTLRELTADHLIQMTGNGGGSRTPADEQRKNVIIFDVFHDVASVKAEMANWIDYMHLAKIDGEWKIVNVLWDWTPEAKARWKKRDT